VAIKEGIPVFTTKNPLIVPRAIPTIKVKIKVIISGTFHARRLIKTKELTGIIDATDISNSPAIIRIPTPREIIPRSGISLPSAPMLFDPTNVWFGVKKEKNTTRMTKTMNVNDALYDKKLALLLPMVHSQSLF